MTHAYLEESPLATDAEYAAAGDYSAADDPFADTGFQIWPVGAKYEVRKSGAVVCVCDSYLDAAAAANRAILNRAIHNDTRVAE